MAATPDEQQRRIDKAQAKSAEQAAAGVFPYHLATATAAGQTVSRWAVPSRTTADTLYSVVATRPAGQTIDLGSIRTNCDCPSVGPCWHRAHVRSAMLGAIRYRTSAGKYASAHKPATRPQNALQTA